MAGQIAGREEFIPDEGVGYWLGIAGGTTLLFQLAYPLRKRSKSMRRMGSATSWFRLHMILGIVGPILILYHSNFSLGATNSNVALFTLLAVAASGVIGRYFYGRIHRGLYGTHADLTDLLTDATSLLMVVENDVGGARGTIAKTLTDFGQSGTRTEVWSGYKRAPCRQRGHHHAGAADPPPESDRDSGPGKRHPARLEFRRAPRPFPCGPHSRR